MSKARTPALLFSALILMILLALQAMAPPPSGAAPGQSSKPAPQAARGGETIGSDACQACHDGYTPGKLAYHKAIETNKRLNAAGKTCESCHGPGKAHAESGDPSLIFSFRAASAEKASLACLSCHAQGLRTGGRMFDAHSRNSVSCIGCHSVHQPKVEQALLLDRPTANCSSCHPNVLAEFARPFRHKVTEGVISCTDCHNPHGAPRRGQRRQVAANEVACLGCHGNLRGPFVFEHVPVRTEGCQSCHEPHGSVHARLLKRTPQHLLCLECHTLSSSAMGVSPPAFHNINTPRFQNCTTCHRKIHGSNVDRIFER